MPEPFFHSLGSLPFVELESIDSTNNYALAQLHAGLAQHGTAFFAKDQLAGKGQRGKSWTTDKDSSIILSVVIDPYPLSLAKQFELSACVAVSACCFLKKYAGDEVKIKWPNDLFWQDRKAGGILIENIIGGKEPKIKNRHPVIEKHNSSAWRWTVIGIGINIRQTVFPEQLINPVSLQQITGADYSPLELGMELHRSILQNFHKLVTSGFDEFYRSYLSLLYKKGTSVKFKKGSRGFDGIVKSVTPGGKLIVQHAIEEEYDFGEIEWLIPAATRCK